MGLVTDVLSFPIVAPARGLLFVFEKIKEAVDAELSDESRLESALMGLSLRLDLGEIPETDYREAEEAILKELSALQKHKESRAVTATTRGRSRR